MRLADWNETEHVARLVDMTDERAIPWIIGKYGGNRPQVLEAVLSHAYALGSRTAVVEYRYIDLDWRSEHRSFYAKTFRRYPSITHRIHFFEASSDELSDTTPENIQALPYLGYTIIRPVAAAPVGRTFLAARDPETVTCSATETINLFGAELKVVGIAFIAQDAQLTRCAQTTTWVTAYHHHRRFRGPRALPGTIAASVGQASEHGRSLPSPGLTTGQIADASRAVGLPPLVYPLHHLPASENLERVICRYLNSGLPVTITTHSHAFVLVGYTTVEGTDGRRVIRFVRHDDEAGPYRTVDPRLDEHGPWNYAIVPLPDKVYLPGENAEAVGHRWLTNALRQSPSPDAATLVADLETDGGAFMFRTTAVLSNEFKTSLKARHYPAAPASAYARMQMSRWVWVVELTDRAARDSGEPCVVAEAIIDATDHDRDPNPLGWRIPGEIWAWVPDDDEQQMMSIDTMAMTESVAHPNIR